MVLSVISTGYPPNTAYLVWDIPHENIQSYRVYRNGVVIADSSIEEQKSLFEQPTMFDHDHHTNLFRKDSAKKLMYTDTDNVGNYREYSYLIVAYGISNEIINSNNVDIITM